MKLLLLLDGLNEIRESRRESLVTAIHGFKKSADFKISVLITSRSIGVTEELLGLLGGDVPIYEIQRWSEKQLIDYFRANKVAVQILSGLSKEMRNSLRLPLFAWLYLQLNRTGTARVFNTIGEIFDDFIRTRLESVPSDGKSDQQSKNQFNYDFPLIKRRGAIANLAFQMTNGRSVNVECGKLEKICREMGKQEVFGPMALDLINSGILRLDRQATLDPSIKLDILRGTSVMFLHQAIQEYLTAAYVIDAPEGRQLLPEDLSKDAFWRDVPIYILRSINLETVEGRNATWELINHFADSPKPDFWTAIRLINCINEADGIAIRETVTDKLLSVLSTDSWYPYAIHAFSELGEYGRERLLNEIRNSQYLKTVIAIPETHLSYYDKDIVRAADQISDREAVWRTLGRSVYILGELGEPRLIDVILPQMGDITSVHLLYHVVEAMLSIVRLEPDHSDLYCKINDRLQGLAWLDHRDPIIAAYSAAIIRQICPEIELNTESIALKLMTFLRDRTSARNEHFEDEFWQRAHGIDVIPEIIDTDSALDLMLELLLKENESIYGAGKVKGYGPIHSSILKGAIRLQRRVQIGFAKMQKLIETAIRSKRISNNSFACDHLENLLLLTCTENESNWLRDWINNKDIPDGTRRVLCNVSHALLRN